MKIKVSVIIPAYKDAENLERCLISLAKYKGDSTEIIVVDDGPFDEVVALAKKYPVNLIRSDKNRGAAYARNAGARESSGSILLYTDDDCVPMEKWAELLSNDLISSNSKDKDVVSVCGRVISDNGYIEMAHSYSGYGYVQKGERKYMEYINSANFAVFKEAYLKVGGFSEDLTVSEDPEFALKLCEAGYKIIFEPSISVYHNHGVDTFIKFIAKHKAWGKRLGNKMVSKHKNRYGFQAWVNQYPALMFLMIIPAAIATTVKIVFTNISYDIKVLFYAPAVFLSKVFFRWGMFIGSDK